MSEALNRDREGLFEFREFRGLRNNSDPRDFDPGDLDVALNVDIDDALALHRRYGYSSVLVSGVDRDLWAKDNLCVGVGSNTLKRINPDYTTTDLRSGLTPGLRLSYEILAGRLYYANGAELGCVVNGVNRGWGITPPGLPVAAATAGALPAGRYQFAVVYVRDDGQLSGTGRAGVIELATAGGIAFTSIPVSSQSTVARTEIYCTAANGETLFRAASLPAGTTTFTLVAQEKQSLPLITQFLQPPPAGTELGLFKGWMLVAKGNRLYVSEPYAPELFDYRKSFAFTDAITLLAPVVDGGDGVWVGTESQILWLAGESPEQWDFKVAADYGVVHGAQAYVDAELIGDGSMRGSQAIVFASKRGLCYGAPGGAFGNMTEARFAYPIQEYGAMLVRRHRGIAQVLCTLQGTETAGNVFS